MAVSAQFHVNQQVLTSLDLVRESLFEIAAATEHAPQVQHEVADAFRWLDEAMTMLLPEGG